MLDMSLLRHRHTVEMMDLGQPANSFSLIPAAQGPKAPLNCVANR